MLMLVFCQCSGTESQLSACPHSSGHDCTEAEAAGVFCEEAAEDQRENCLEFDISYQHTFNQQLDQVVVETAEDCQAECLQHADCDHFTFNTSRSECLERNTVEVKTPLS